MLAQALERFAKDLELPTKLLGDDGKLVRAGLRTRGRTRGRRRWLLLARGQGTSLRGPTGSSQASPRPARTSRTLAQRSRPGHTVGLGVLGAGEPATAANWAGSRSGN